MHKYSLLIHNFLICEARNLKKKAAKLPANSADLQKNQKIQPHSRPLKNFEK